MRPYEEHGHAEGVVAVEDVPVLIRIGSDDPRPAGVALREALKDRLDARGSPALGRGAWL